jgi:hypothetical protein
LQNDHIGAGGWQASDWEETMSYTRVPDFAKKYKCEMMDIRTPWKKYAADNKYAWQDMLADGIHLNDRGKYLMGALICRHLAISLSFLPIQRD